MNTECVLLYVVGADVCLQGWKYYNNTCYKIFTRDRTWASAREHCKWFQDGELAKLPKPQELIPENNKIIWIGLKYEVNSTCIFNETQTFITQIEIQIQFQCF